MSRLPVVLTLSILGLLRSPDLCAQETGTVKGTITLDITGEPIGGALVLITSLGKTASTGGDSRFDFVNVPAGAQEILAVREHLSAGRKTITVTGGQVTEVDFSLSLMPVHKSVTVTASAGGRTTTFEAFNSIVTLDSLDLAEEMVGTLGEILEDEPGIYKRGFGPGSNRPIIRGFDGDRVLIMEDGVRTGDLSSQSGDHGVTIDPAGLERIEVVKGPATLLYGSNAVGGVVNAVTPHDAFFHTSVASGLRGRITTDLGSANQQAGLNGRRRRRA